MFANRLPQFAQNFQAPILRCQAEGRTDLVEIIDEKVMFACPLCGHTTMDHSWTAVGAAPCLMGRDAFGKPISGSCPCQGFDYESAQWTEAASIAFTDELVALADEVLPTYSGESTRV